MPKRILLLKFTFSMRTDQHVKGEGDKEEGAGCAARGQVGFVLSDLANRNVRAMLIRMPYAE